MFTDDVREPTHDVLRFQPGKTNSESTMSTRKPKPSLVSEIEAPEERLQLITLTAEPKAIQVSPQRGPLKQSSWMAPLPAGDKRRLH
jgi:hypothetical protein